MKDLSVKQRKVLEFIRDAVSRDNLPPTIREIAAAFGFSSTGTVRDYLRALQKKGFLAVSPLKARAIELSQQAAGIPLVGRVAAGAPLLAQESIEGYVRVDDLCRTAARLFALRVKGDSMIDKGIMENDVVIVRQQPRAENGDIVVALIGDEATVKIFRKRQAGAFLEPANRRYQPLSCSESTRILGKVIRVIRIYV